MRNRLFILIALSALLLVGCGPTGRYSATVITEGSHRLEKGEALATALVLMDGQFVVAEEARLSGSALVLGGVLDIQGHLEGDVSVLQGEVRLGPEAQVQGDLIMTGGVLEKANGALIAGQLDSGGLGPDSLLPDNASASPSVAGLIFRSLLQALIAAALVRFLPRPTRRITHAIMQNTLVSGAVGVFAGLIGLILMVQMAFTVVLIPMSLLLGLLILVAVSMSSVLYGVAIGLELRNRWRPALKDHWAAAAGTAIFTLGMTMLQLVPYMGAALQLLLIACALGALLLTRLGSREFSPKQQPIL